MIICLILTLIVFSLYCYRGNFLRENFETTIISAAGFIVVWPIILTIEIIRKLQNN